VDLAVKATKVLALFLAIVFLVVSCGCSHSPKQPASASPAKDSSSPNGVVYSTPPEDKWWKKDEVQWLMLTLIIVGVALAAGAAVAIAFGGGGLAVGASK
jgi:hypothetical protein